MSLSVGAYEMPASFKHPLARSACLRPAVSVDGGERPVLVIATTLELDPNGRRYERALVDKLARAVTGHLSHFQSVDEFVLINRPRDWRA
jgi:hypothetical protein